MKKITLLFILTLTITTWSYSQCTTFSGGQWPTGTITVLNNGTAEQIATNNWPNAEYSVIDGLIIGNTYTVTGTNTTSIYITIETDAGAILGHGASSVNFTATTVSVFINWHLDAACGTQASDDTATSIQCTSPSCTCTATGNPDAATTPAPGDMAIDIPIDNSDPANLLITPFSWVDATTGGAPESYNISLGTTTSGDDIGTLSGFPNGDGIVYTWQYSTTYYWKVDAVNCSGTTAGTVWSFTTEADPALSVDAFESNSITHFYNTNSNSLVLKSSNLVFTNLEIFDILGKQVLTKKLNSKEESINLNTINTGIYIAKISTNNGVKTIKFVKK